MEHPVEATRLRVAEVPPQPRVGAEGDVGCGPIDEHAIDAGRAVRRAPADDQGHRPPVAPACGRDLRIREEALLTHAQHAVCRAFRPTEGDQREAGLLDPRLRDARDLAARRGFQGMPQVGGDGVALAMAPHVEAHAVAELLGSEEVLDHAHDGGTLLVRDRVEVLRRLGDAAHFAVDRVRVGERVECQGARPVVLEALPEPPLRPPVVDDAIGHPGGERLVQPEVVPPRHRDEVAVPHVRELVRDHLARPLVLVERHGRRIEQEQRLAEEHRAGVLHRTGLEVRHGHEVELAVRIRDVEVLLEATQRLGRGLEPELGQVTLPRRVPDADRDVSEASLGGRLERTDGEGEQVRRQQWCRREADHVAVGPVVLGLDRAVGDRTEAVRHGDGETEPRLERGLVEAREDTTGVGRLALAEGVASAVGTRGIQPAQVLVQASAEAKAEPRVAGG